jgi:hypothetical protein
MNFHLHLQGCSGSREGQADWAGQATMGTGLCRMAVVMAELPLPSTIAYRFHFTLMPELKLWCW